MNIWERLSIIAPQGLVPPTWTTQAAKLRNELSNVVSSWVGLGN